MPIKDVILCKDCYWFGTNYPGSGAKICKNPKMHHCTYCGPIFVSEDFYCGYAKANKEEKE